MTVNNTQEPVKSVTRQRYGDGALCLKSNTGLYFVMRSKTHINRDAAPSWSIERTAGWSNQPCGASIVRPLTGDEHNVVRAIFAEDGAEALASFDKHMALIGNNPINV